MPFFDLASLTKPLVTAPLVLQHLDLDADRRHQLGFEERTDPLTVRQLLSHSSGLPAWLPYTGEPLAEQLRRGMPEGHPLFREGRQGLAVYSDLGYRLLAELLERETGRAFPELGLEATGLVPAPWEDSVEAIPDGPDAAAWTLAEPQCTLPSRAANLPHDANARAGMRGHAGFGCTPVQMKTWLRAWAGSRTPARMAVETARAADGTVWGLGLQRVFDGAWHFGQLLSRIPLGISGRPRVELHGNRSASSAAGAQARSGQAHGLLDALRLHGTGPLHPSGGWPLPLPAPASPRPRG